MLKALIFDCDGVLVDTERNGHRVAFNRAFAKKGLAANWDVPAYEELLKIAGGKERMSAYFNKEGWPKNIFDKEGLIKELHKLKTDLFMEIIAAGELPLRGGVARLVDEAIADKVMLAVCSTSNERAVNLVVEKMLGTKRKGAFRAILAGDIVKKKKPDPEIYNLVLTHLNVSPAECVVVEDSRNGFLAAKAAGMHCVVTTNGYTQNEVFTGADMIVNELGDVPNVKVTLEMLKKITAGA
jgi:HAD superfamily hydrolase (TIGR01509 family)